MNLYKFVFILISFATLSTDIFAQVNEEMTKDQWQNEMNNLTAQKESLINEVSSLKSEVANLTKLSSSIQSYDDCINSIYSLLGATKTDIDNFRQKLSSLTSKINNQQGPKADREAELDLMKKNKISALPEFFDVVQNQLQIKLDAWNEKPKDITYNVVRGDCLWNIAKKEENYSNPFAWPVIYQANRDQIKNPDLIFPKQIFKIPYLTEDESAKYEKIRRNYKPAPVAQAQSNFAP